MTIDHHLEEKAAALYYIKNRKNSEIVYENLKNKPSAIYSIQGDNGGQIFDINLIKYELNHNS